jgi:hypothetical protein
MPKRALRRSENGCAGAVLVFSPLDVDVLVPDGDEKEGGAVLFRGGTHTNGLFYLWLARLLSLFSVPLNIFFLFRRFFPAALAQENERSPFFFMLLHQ